MEELKHTCANCEEVFDETVKLSKCGKCKVMHYCSEECQKEDWPRHKEECTKIESVMGLNHAITSAEKVSDFDAILVALKKKCAPACGSFIVWTAQNNVEGLTHFTDNTSPNSFAIGFAKCPQCPETPYNKDEQISFTIIHKQKAYRTGYQGTHDTKEIPQIKTMPRVLVNDFVDTNCVLLVEQVDDENVMTAVYTCGHRYPQNQWKRELRRHRHS